MGEPILGEIRIFSFGFTPRGWLPCDGRLLPIAEYTALFSLLGTAYGGDGSSSFALPNFQGRVPMSFGRGPSLSNFAIGQLGGAKNLTISIAEMAPHSHDLRATYAEADTDDPSNASLANTRSNIYAKPSEPPVPLNTGLVEGCITSTGGDEPADNMQPYLCVNFCIASQGMYPSRP